MLMTLMTLMSRHIDLGLMSEWVPLPGRMLAGPGAPPLMRLQTEGRLKLDVRMSGSL